MKIYAIGDLHLSGKPPSKPMEIFGKHWADHAAKVAANWHQLISSDDTVIICGDTSWAMDLQDALTDLNWIAALPGRKIILRGNHDYWWSTAAKFRKFCEENGFDTDLVKIDPRRDWDKDPLFVEDYDLVCLGWLAPAFI